MEHTTFNTAQERISWVDAFKGLCIVMMVWGHTGAPGTAYIYLFHVPAFFILSGYTQKLDVKHPFRIIGKRFLTLFVPYFVINEGFFALYSILNRMGLYSYVSDTPPTGFRRQCRRSAGQHGFYSCCSSRRQWCFYYSLHFQKPSIHTDGFF